MLNARNTLGMTGGSRRSILVGSALVAAALALLAAQAEGQTTEHDSASPQFSLRGRVVSAQSGKALPGAWVGISETEWGSITNDAGLFRIPDLGPGPLALTVELLGYETLQWSGNVSADDDEVILELTPQPVVLEGLKVMTDRFRSRRNAVATSVFAYEPADLSSTSSRTALEFVELRAGASTLSCAGRRGGLCLLVRGRVVEPDVYIDEQPVLGGMAYLDAFQPWEFHMIEIYGGGRHIRAYTPAFMERVAEHRILPVRLPY